MSSQHSAEPALTADDPAPEAISFVCPRCGESRQERFYGPCQSCRQTLQATYQQSTNEVEAPEYEPKMNVTPNAIATKE